LLISKNGKGLDERWKNFGKSTKRQQVMRSGKPLKNILIIFALISLSGCVPWFTRVVYIPTEECRKYTQPLLDEKDERIDILRKELHYKSEKLRDCENKL